MISRVGPAGRKIGHVHFWIMASELVGNTYQNKNRIPTVQGPCLVVEPVRERRSGGR
jgi:hypothetical protein